MHRYLRTLKFSSILWVLGLPTYGVEIKLPGLDIEKILAPNTIASNVEVPANTIRLDVMLQHYPFSTSIIDDQVAVNLIEQTAQLSDTDESIEDEKIAEKTPKKFTSKFSIDQSKTLLKPSEIDLSQSPDQITGDLCRKLAQDAFRIANAHKNARTREATTCLCVVLRDEKKRPKKLIFHNSTGEMQQSMREKAIDLGYDLKNAYLAHAEIQLIDFLTYRAQQQANAEKTAQLSGEVHKPKYTHILGMGCSRKHCQECNPVCKLFLGCNYALFTAAIEKLADEPSMPVIPVIGVLPQEDEADLQMTIPAAVQRFKVAWQEDAMRSGGNKSANYRLSETMQQCIQDKSRLELDLTDDRFNPTRHTVTQSSTEAVIPPTEGDMDDIDEQKTENSEELKTPAREKKKVNPY
ncbi:MAG: hypothetical protein RL012_268 [Bacteroidota bacterium]|jgi:hypothetical protein